VLTLRNSAKAIIIKDGKLLCTKNVSQFNEVYYLLPGGGQEAGETLVETLIRECREEVGLEICAPELRYVRDYIGRNHEFKQILGDVHQIEYMFRCEVKSAAIDANGKSPDYYQVGIEWVELSKLSNVRLYPRILLELISASGELRGNVYLGDVN
jgi:8-oxo-dGTP diphosphatase